jgi:molybdopterin synthase catalytic subunit
MTSLLITIFNFKKVIPSALYHQAAVANYILAEPLDVMGLFAQAHHESAGAIVLFSGEVRNSHNGKEVAFLQYEAKTSMANKMIEAILIEATERYGLMVAKAVHRVGKVTVSEPAVVVITAAAHRKESYEANQFIIDKIKHEVPIWKCEIFTDDTKLWGGNCNCN